MVITDKLFDHDAVETCNAPLAGLYCAQIQQFQPSPPRAEKENLQSHEVPMSWPKRNGYSKILAAAILTSVVILGLVHPSIGQTVSHLYSFTPQGSSQGPQEVTLAQGRDGKLYGTTLGNTNGSIFRITVGDVFKEIFAFQSPSGADAGMLLATDGNFYGTTPGGGDAPLGVLFKITPTGTYSVLHTFVGGSDGAHPTSAPMQASDGNLYGTTRGDGSGSTVYRYALSGSISTIYQFDGTAGQIAAASLIEAVAGNLYGTAVSGGSENCGTIFQMSTAGVVLQTYSFPCGTGGSQPAAPLIQASDGNFYGTTDTGGLYNKGTIFRMTPNFQVSILHHFAGGGNDGNGPSLGLMQATDGNLYGMTTLGGAANMGTIYQVSSAGVYTVLYSFRGRTGKLPLGGLLQHTKGLLWGTASQGGANDLGTVFALDMGLGPFITFVQHSGKVGQTAQILGQGLKGTTSVTFNGVSATSFFAGADTYLRVVIPSGATTGPVVVTTASGKLSSNVNFVVTQ